MNDKERTLDLFEKMLDLKDELDELDEKSKDLLEQCELAKN